MVKIGPIRVSINNQNDDYEKQYWPWLNFGQFSFKKQPKINHIYW